MYYIQLDDENRVMCWTEADENPDDGIWLDSPWGSVPDDFDDWIYENGSLVHSPRDLPPVPYRPEEVLAAMFTAQPEMLDELPDDALAHMAPYMQEWQPDTAYAIGDKRSHLELPYRCLQPHTSNETYPPDEAVSLWARILPGQGGTEIGVWEQPESTNPYMKGDRVHFPTISDPIYESDYDNNIWAPNVFGWHVVEGA